mgnify:FL=1
MHVINIKARVAQLRGPELVLHVLQRDTRSKIKFNTIMSGFTRNANEMNRIRQPEMAVLLFVVIKDYAETGIKIVTECCKPLEAKPCFRVHHSFSFIFLVTQLKCII